MNFVHFLNNLDDNAEYAGKSESDFLLMYTLYLGTYGTKNIFVVLDVGFCIKQNSLMD